MEAVSAWIMERQKDLQAIGPSTMMLLARPKAVGPTKGISAPDAFTNAQMIAWMRDEYNLSVVNLRLASYYCRDSKSS